jgi:hypothetical protein
MRLRSFPAAFKRVLGRWTGRRQRPESGPAPDPELGSLAASAIKEYAEAHPALFERADRLGEKAERLQSLGTPSESANNRARRAKREVEVALAALRATFAASTGGSEAAHAFDREVERRYPSLGLPGADL